MSDDGDWPARWRGRFVWDAAPPPGEWWTPARPLAARSCVLRHRFEAPAGASLRLRIACDGRYALVLNGEVVARGPVRDDPALLVWDGIDVGPLLRDGANVLVALCRHDGQATPTFLPAARCGELGAGAVCIESHPASDVAIATDARWIALPSPWLEGGAAGFTGTPPEEVDGRLIAPGLHDPDIELAGTLAVVLASGPWTVDDRPPAAPHTVVVPRPIPLLGGPLHEAVATATLPVQLPAGDDVLARWRALVVGEGATVVTVADVGALTLGHVTLVVRGAAPGDEVLVAAGEEMRPDGLPEIDPRMWLARYRCRGDGVEEVELAEPVGARHLAAVHPPGATVALRVQEHVYPAAPEAAFACDDAAVERLWTAGLRTVALCATDAFVDCPGRERRAWLADGHVQSLITLVTSHDRRLVRRHLEAAARSRRPDGLLGMAYGCDLTRSALTIPDFSLHWIRTLAAYWLHTGDEATVRPLVPVAEGILERLDAYRGASGLLEDVPGWVFIDWAQVDRDTVTGALDALYAVALRDYAALPGSGQSATDARGHLATTVSGQSTNATGHLATAFDALWDEERGAYVDALGERGRSRRMSQQTNAAALLAGLVPAQRVPRVVEQLLAPRDGGRLVVTATFADPPGSDIDTLWTPPAGFDEERDVVAAQPFFRHIVHAALAHAGRADAIVPLLGAWREQVAAGDTLHEFWTTPRGVASTCHGWSACATHDLLTYVLGARPTAPGWAQAVVEPRLGPLAWARGRLPTALGPLAVAVDQHRIEVDAPAGMTVAVAGETVAGGAGPVRVTPS